MMMASPTSCAPSPLVVNTPPSADEIARRRADLDRLFGAKPRPVFDRFAPKESHEETY
jgi:hypothetical protein